MSRHDAIARSEQNACGQLFNDNVRGDLVHVQKLEANGT